ncbi:MAG TPA: alpha/beta hydrolase [Burkholderiaceae bacterium]|nr:alpha/beta hydrolase [Burkholderiaceae bacterium]
MPRPSHSRFVDVRGLRYHLRLWGEPQHGSRTLVMLHGWMDVSASFQFVADALGPGWQVIAPDWRGYGLTERALADCYWFPDYLADLERVLDGLTPDPVVLVGHSMGGNVALLYAGIRPGRVRAVVNLEGFGLRETHASQAPGRYAQWLDELLAGSSLRNYASPEDVAARLRRNNPRLTAERAEFLARHWALEQADGRWAVAGDPAHRIVNPTLYRLDEVLACWERIACPVLWVRAEGTDVLRFVAENPAAAIDEVERRRAVIPDVEDLVIGDAGHMVHHDQPERVARAIVDFLARKVDAAGR